MALTIVRNDITKMHVDAIVNTTNEYFEVGGVGVDAGIHYAAGPGLKKALAEIGYCPVGSAVITDSFNITSCRYIIHTVGPVYWDGSNGEAEKLKSCYRSILSLARGKGCRSLAIPSISTGAYRYPKAEAYSIATSCIREFLLSLPDDEDMMVYLVLFDRESVAVSEKVDSEVEQYIDEEYTYKKKADLHSHYRENRSGRRRGQNRPSDQDDMPPSVRPYGKPVFMEEPPVPVAASETHSSVDGYRDVDLSFAEMCEWWCTEKGITKKEFYIQANINKAMFWNMKKNPGQIPKKTNALACVIGLRLDYDQAIDLLGRAGMTLSKYYETDRVVEDRIRKKIYDIDEINLVLFDKDLALLGSYA